MNCALTCLWAESSFFKSVQATLSEWDMQSPGSKRVADLTKQVGSILIKCMCEESKGGGVHAVHYPSTVSTGFQ